MGNGEYDGNVSFDLGVLEMAQSGEVDAFDYDFSYGEDQDDQSESIEGTVLRRVGAHNQSGH